MMKNKVLIIGKIPPPVGGVTVHVSRFIDQLNTLGYTDYVFLDLKRTSITGVIHAILSHPVIHLHTSNTYLQFLITLLTRFLNRKLIITFHGNMGRYGNFRDILTKLCCKYCTVPIVQNEYSYQKAINLNTRTILLSAYIQARIQTPLSPTTALLIEAFTYKYDYLFCTNASTLSFDRSELEIYGIGDLTDVFANLPKAGLIISDPSGRYIRYIGTKNALPPNICFISTPHDFLSILDYADCLIRNTTTDGDSISIHEALEKGVIVMATDCVSRPVGCRTYRHISNLDLIAELKSAQRDQCCSTGESNANVTNALVDLYDVCMRNVLQ
ncbi:MAG TPA: hypothetical protein VGN64_15510 [Dyadobacter sp.]|jgi:hypothetical protein|nr:hypothetical protein [Dyadobacter sp.]